VLRPITLSRGDKLISLYPSDFFKVTYSISFDHPLLRHQSHTLRVDESASSTTSRRRGLRFLNEVELLRQQGLALEVPRERDRVERDRRADNQLRYEDEFVRHKILDAIGDLALVAIDYRTPGRPPGRPRAAHGLREADSRGADAWKLVELVPEQAAGFVPVAVAVKAG